MRLLKPSSRLTCPSTVLLVMLWKLGRKVRRNKLRRCWTLEILWKRARGIPMRILGERKDDVSMVKFSNPFCLVRYTVTWVGIWAPGPSKLYFYGWFYSRHLHTILLTAKRDVRWEDSRPPSLLCAGREERAWELEESATL